MGVYVVVTNDGRYFKVGYTRGDVQKRIKGLQTGNHCQIELLAYEDSFDERTENHIHKLLHVHSSSGGTEWFTWSDKAEAILKRFFSFGKVYLPGLIEDDFADCNLTELSVNELEEKMIETIGHIPKVLANSLPIHTMRARAYIANALNEDVAFETEESLFSFLSDQGINRDVAIRLAQYLYSPIRVSGNRCAETCIFRNDRMLNAIFLTERNDIKYIESWAYETHWMIDQAEIGIAAGLITSSREVVLLPPEISLCQM